MNGEVKQQIRKFIPRKPKIWGFYDDEEERWIKLPPEELEVLLGLAIEEIPIFVEEVIKQIRTLKRVNVEKITFSLMVQGNKVNFSVKFDE